MKLVRIGKQEYNSATFTDTNSLANLGITRPEIIGTLYRTAEWQKMERKGMLSGLAINKKSLLTHFLRYNNYVGTPDKIGKDLPKLKVNTRDLNSSEIYWVRQGTPAHAPTIVNVDSGMSPVDKVGIGHSIFFLTLNTNTLNRGHVVQFEDNSQAQVVTDAETLGAGKFRYRMQIVSQNDKSYIAADALATGKKVGIGYNAVPEASEPRGYYQSTPNWYRNQMMISRWDAGWSGSSFNNVLVFEFKDEKGKSITGWEFEQFLQLMFQVSDETEKGLGWARYNKGSDDLIKNLDYDTGRPVSISSGVFTQMSEHNVWTANTLTTDLLFEIMMELGRCGIDASDMICFTGMGGIKEMHRTLEKAANIQVLDQNTRVKELKDGNLAFGGFFTTYIGWGGKRLHVAHHEMMDDSNFHVKRAKNDNFTAESYNMYFMLPGTKYEPNVQLCTRTGRDLLVWASGGAPSGSDIANINAGNLQQYFKRSAMASHGGDYAHTHILTEGAPIISNIDATLKLTLNR